MWRRMERISWMDKITNEDILNKVEEKRQLISVIKKNRKKNCIGHELMVELYGNMKRKAEKGMNGGIKCHGPADRQNNDNTGRSCMINDRIYM